jgi:hypothetical protein
VAPTEPWAARTNFSINTKPLWGYDVIKVLVSHKINLLKKIYTNECINEYSDEPKLRRSYVFIEKTF